MLKMYVTLQTLFVAGVDRFKNEERGATATEYALLVSFIALAILVGVTAFGSQLNSFFTGLAGRITK